MAETFQSANADFRREVEEIFNKAEFIRLLGIRLKDAGPGWCETTLTLEPKHMQQDGFAHAGLIATMADHTSGAAGGSLVARHEMVLTVEYKINLLRPGVGESLFCRADVLRAGKRIIVSESSVYANTGPARKLVAKGMFTLSVIPAVSGDAHAHAVR